MSRSMTVAILLGLVAGCYILLRVADKKWFPQPEVAASDEEGNNFYHVCGKMFTLTDGKQFVSYGGAGYYTYKDGVVGKDPVKPPKNGMVIETIDLLNWSVQEEISFTPQPGAKCLSVTVDWGGIETPESSGFIAEMEQKTRDRHPGENWNANDNALLKQWIRDEAAAVVGGKDGEHWPYVPAEEVKHRLAERFRKLQDQYNLGTSAHWSTITTVEWFDNG